MISWTGMTSKENPWLPVESDACRNVAYLIKDGHIIIDGGNSGMLAIKMDHRLIEDLSTELIEMVDVYGENQ